METDWQHTQTAYPEDSITKAGVGMESSRSTKKRESQEDLENGNLEDAEQEGKSGGLEKTEGIFATNCQDFAVTVRKKQSTVVRICLGPMLHKEIQEFSQVSK